MTEIDWRSMFKTVLNRMREAGESNEMGARWMATEASNAVYAALAAKDAEIEALQFRLNAVEHSVRVGSDVDHERDFLAMEARRYASHYPEASDGRNTFVMFAEMIEARAALNPEASK